MDSIILTIVSGLALGAYYLVDPNKDMERHLHKNETKKYYVLQLASAILLLSFAFNSKFLIVKFGKAIYTAGIRYLRHH